ncbi:hypothetical protein [Yinghuangia soli]|uniref:Uncharacterized protein n=1 Tax=Yinghuangia soli TaxID=2908204 RepID=A0AA41Q583_9ACTN|nr:hypothetical protein [Yinghuangia soli]MCF2531814.1 hypothetical protein [Yinghuangia soli]
MIFRDRALPKAVDLLERALEGQDEALLNDAFHNLRDAMGESQPQTCAAAGPRLAALLPRTPMGAAAILAVMIGACVEHGADPAACAGPVFDRIEDALTNVAGFPALWDETVGGELPQRDHLALGEALGRIAEVTGGIDEATFAAVSAWMELPLWEMAAVTLLSYEPIRQAVQEEGSLVVLADAAAMGDADLKCLRYLLKMFDAEPLVVVHRPTGTAYRMRMSRIGDNFQLHTLLAHLLVGGGHVPGEAPPAAVVAAMRDAPLADPPPQATGSFNLAAADGSWIWNEGCPADIPVVDGERLLILDPPPYGRAWQATRFYPQIAGDLVLEKVLDRAEADAYLAKAAPARDRPSV